jgi:DNA polymerase III alpha subunit (gram-positive type)
MSNSRPLILLDTETSGLDPNPENGHAEVIELYAKAIQPWDLEDHHAGVFHTYIKPQHPETASAGALAVIGDGWTIAQKEGVESKVAWSQFNKWCESLNPKGGVFTRPIFMAYNAPFDAKFCRYHMLEHKLIKKSDYGWEFPWSFEFDIMNMAFMLFENDPSVSNFKLETILNKFGIKRENPDVHSAAEDVELMAQWVKRAFKFCRECNKRMKIS